MKIDNSREDQTWSNRAWSNHGGRKISLVARTFAEGQDEVSATKAITEPLLSLAEASLRLRIVPRLILKCVKYQARRNGGIKLKCVDIHGEPFFRDADLVEYDSDLRKPWVDDLKAPRPSLPDFFATYLQCEALLRCGLCDSPYAGQYAHITPWEECHHHHPLNLILLCTTCHEGYDKEKRITKEEILAAKERLLERLLVAGNTTSDPEYPSLPAVCRRIAQLLDENSLVFYAFGPESPLAESVFEPGADRIWKQKRADTILPNNQQIVDLLKQCAGLFQHDEDFKKLATAFITHAMSYASFVAEANTVHKRFRFPYEFDQRVRWEAKRDAR